MTTHRLVRLLAKRALPAPLKVLVLAGLLSACSRPQQCIEVVKTTEVSADTVDAGGKAPSRPIADMGGISVRAFGSLGRDVVNAEMSRHDPRNAAYSPVAVAGAVALLERGSRGATRADVFAAAGVRDGREERFEVAPQVLRALAQPRPSIQLTLATRVFVPSSLPLRSDFVQAMRSDFDTTPGALDLGAPGSVALVDTWVGEQTHEAVTSMLDAGSPTHAKKIVVSAVTARARWATPFSEPKPSTFTLADGAKIEVPTLTTTVLANVGTFVDHDRSYHRVLEIPLEDWEASMLIFVPPENADWKLAESEFFGGNTPHTLMMPPQTKGGPVRVAVSLPVFTMRSSVSSELSTALSGLGYPWFKQGAEWGAATPTALDQVYHQVSVQVGQHGLGVVEPPPPATEPVAANEPDAIPESLRALMKPGGFDAPATSFFVARPFLYMIVERHSGLVLFQGRLMDPRWP